jgi:3-dehydroquinate synthase
MRSMLQAQQESPREVSAGLAEVIKCAAVGDAEFFAWLESQLDALRARESTAVAHAVQRFPELRAQIESQDRKLQRAPSPLSFGTRLGGVIESLVGYGQYLHGETVGLGMWLSTALGEDLGVQSPASAARLRDVLVRAGLPTRLPRVAAARWLELLPVDRDGPQGMLELVLLEEVGRPQVRRVPPSAVLEALDKAGALSSG